MELEENTILLYENYKEPLKKVPSGKGFGYYGTIAMTEDREYIQCHICGKLFKSLGKHICMHGTLARDYKKEFGLALSTALVSDKVRNDMKDSVLHCKPENVLSNLREANSRRHNGTIKVKGYDYSLEWRNKKGLCPDQVLQKILDLKEEIGKTPSEDEFRDRYNGKYLKPIYYQHGSWTKAVEKLGLKTRKELLVPTENELIVELQDFYKLNCRIPTTSDFNRGLLRDKNVYIRKFGTLNDARISAGLNAVISQGFGNIIELTPEEYFEYQDGHRKEYGLTKEALRKREERRKKREKASLAYDPIY